jgi:hypothetical protein
LQDPHVADKLAEARAELRLAQPCADAGLLPRLADRTDFADAVCKILVLADCPDTVCNFCRATVFRVTCAELSRTGRRRAGVSAALVGLCAPPFREDGGAPCLL